MRGKRGTEGCKACGLSHYIIGECWEFDKGKIKGSERKRGK